MHPGLRNEPVYLPPTSDYAADWHGRSTFCIIPLEFITIKGLSPCLGRVTPCRRGLVHARRSPVTQYLPAISQFQRVKNAPRLPADIRISLKKRGGPTHRIELIRQPVGKRYWIRRDGKDSTKLPEATASQIAERIRRWFVSKG